MSNVFIVQSGRDLALLEKLREYLMPFGHEVNDIETTVRTGDSISVLAEIARSDIVLAVLTNQSDNILFELGYSFGLNKPIILISLGSTSPPPVLRDVLLMQFSELDDGAAFRIVAAIETLARSRRAREGGHVEFTSTESRQELSGRNLERYVADWFEAKGIVTHLQEGRDAGFDILAFDPKTKKRYVVEAKALSKSALISVDVIRRLYEAAREADAQAGIIVTTADFTKSAKEFARQFKTPIYLWNVDQRERWYLPKGATVQIRRGDLFEQRADLVMLPCSTAGTVSSWVQAYQDLYKIPSAPSGLSLGEVTIFPAETQRVSTKYFGYAASVESHSTSAEAIERIGVEIGEITNRQPDIRIINVPLLGGGAGGLDHKISAMSLKRGFETSGDQKATLAICTAETNIDEIDLNFRGTL
jgi:hypothetical protein